MLPTLEMQNIGLNYHSRDGETVAIDDISFCVNKNEFVGIVGPSGCGKTTLLSLISGILTPSHGQVLIEGKNREIRKMLEGQNIGTHSLARVRIGNINLDDLRPGDHRELTPNEVKGLLDLCETR